MSIQGMFGGQGANLQSASQGNFKQKTKENTAENAGVKGNKIELNIKPRKEDEEAEKEFDKLLRRPRSRKYMKAIKLLDSLSEGDERIIAEMKKEAGASEEDELTFTPEDMEAFKQRMQGIIEEEVKKQKMEAEKLRDTIAPCYITGCQVHSISPDGTIITHYTKEEIGKKDGTYHFARDLIMKYGGTNRFSSVEIYKHRLVHRNGTGDTIKIYQMDDDGNIE